jgi:hypothetical protein
VHVQQISHILDPVRTDLRFALNYADVLLAYGVVQAGYWWGRTSYSHLVCTDDGDTDERRESVS